MTWAEYRLSAIESASLYYDYLKNSKKGISESGVSGVSVSNSGEVTLILSSKLFSTDEIQLRIRGELYPPGSFIVRFYDRLKNKLLLKPNRLLLSLFHEAIPAEIAVISDLTFLVKRVRDWYEQHDRRLSLPSSPPSLSPDMPSLRSNPSVEQSAAFYGIFQSPLCYVWGAPGTGKTQFVLARAVLAYCKAGIQILITAPTNNAVEQTLRGVLAVLKEADVPLEQVLRLGTPSKEFYDEYPMVCENRAAEYKQESLAAQISFYQRALTFFDTADWFNNAQLILSHSDQVIRQSTSALHELDQRLNDLTSKLNLKNASLAPVVSLINQTTAEKTGLLNYLNKPRSAFSAWLSRPSLDRARHRLAEIDRDLQQDAADYAHTLSECEEFQRQIDSLTNQRSKISSELSDACSALQCIPPCPVPLKFSDIVFSTSFETFKFLEDAQTALLALKQLLNQQSYQYSDITREDAISNLSALSQQIEMLQAESPLSNLSSRLVVAATVDACISRLSDTEFHPAHIFLDEAAYCPLIKGTTLLSYNVPLSLFGDHMQLPPICEAPIDSTRAFDDLMPVCLWAQSSLFLPDLFTKPLEEIFSDYKSATPPKSAKLERYDLLHTFRFGESLSKVLSRFVYASDFHGNPAVDTDIVILDVPKQRSDDSNTNRFECLAIKNFIAAHSTDKYAALTPFRKQRALLSKYINPNLVFTIHGSQGREWDTVFLSVTVTTNHWFLTPRLINTAISRAKKRLIIVCDKEYWARQEDHIIGGLISAAESNPRLTLHAKKEQTN